MAGDDCGANINLKKKQHSEIGCRVLLLHTWNDMYELLRLILKHGGYEALSHNSPENILKVVRAFKPDVIATHDYVMWMNALEIREQVQSDPALATIPWVLITVRSMLADHIPYYRAGFNEVMVLPFGPRELISVIDKWGSISRSERAHRK